MPNVRQMPGLSSSASLSLPKASNRLTLGCRDRLMRPSIIISPQLKIFALLAASLLSFSPPSRAGQVWEVWSRICYSNDMSTEWLVADDRDWNSIFPPNQTTFYFLVPPVVKQVGDHWEITFDASGKKKEKLAEHFDNDQAFKRRPRGYFGTPQSIKAWPMEKNNPVPWFIITSKDRWDGKNTQPNVDPENTGTPYAYNLDPENALAVTFLEPFVTEKEGEWIMTTAGALTEKQKAAITEGYEAWMKSHPGPKPPKPPKIIYSRKMENQHDDWEKALRKWQQAPDKSSCPQLEDFFRLSPAQKAQYEAWQRAQSIWFINGGAGPFPQPVDFIKDEHP